MTDTNTALAPATAGVVKFFIEEKGYGFITPDDGSRDVFVHSNELKRSGVVPASIKTGMRMTFEAIPGKGSGPKAINLKAVT